MEDTTKRPYHNFPQYSSPISTSNNSNHAVPLEFKERCYLCHTFQSNFICQECIRNGNFTSSYDKFSETFLTKQHRLIKLICSKKEKAVICTDILRKKEKVDSLPREISECHERIRILRYLVQEKQEAIKQTQRRTEIAKEKNNTRRLKLPRYKERVEKLSNYVANMKEENLLQRKKLKEKKAELKKSVQMNIADLFEYVFPITKINPTSKSMDEEDSEVISALAEASRMSFIKGTWVLMDSSGEVHHQIIAPTLPGNGDYSSFLAVQNENGVPVTEGIRFNEAYNIGAALCYTTQLVNLLAFYLDVILPKKVNFSDFCSKEITDRKFHRKVAHLNTNVLYLCFSQGMDSALLNPRHTLSNILQLALHTDLGKNGPFHVDSGLTLGLELEEYDFRSDDDSDEDEEDHFPWEWEAIPLVACPESVPGSAMCSTQAATSIAGGLVTSLASMFRGWAGNK